MHVALNALSITNRSGTGRYTWGLIHGFARQRFDTLELSVFIPTEFVIPPGWHNKRKIRFYSIPAKSIIQRILWEQISLPYMLNSIQPDILHSPAFVAPVLKKTACRQIVTIHDLTFTKFPAAIPFVRRMYYRQVIPASIRNAHTVLTDSRAVAEEVNSLPYAPRHVVPVHLGTDTVKFHSETDDNDAAILREYNLTPPYLLFVGTKEPRKNLATLLAAYRSARAKGLKTGLALVGRLGWMYHSDEFESPGVTTIGFVPEEHLPVLYRHAQTLTAPSWYEGFDLPLLESLACGTPVVAASIPVHREVLGDNAVYADPMNVEEWTKALLETARHQKIPATGRIRDWSDTAAETYMVYTTMVGRE